MARRTQLLKAAELERYRAKLLAKREQVLEELGVKFDLQANLGRVAEEDRAHLLHEEFIRLRLNNMEYDQLGQVEEALDRIRAGDYGCCLECGQPISARRLKALPWARYCLICQERLSQAGEPAPERMTAEPL